MTTQIGKVNRYYNSTVIDYKLFWTGSKDLAMHFGYYGKGVKSHKDALLKTNEILAKLADISSNDRVMDAGCGYGGSAIWIAKNVGCKVFGLNVVKYQIEEARKFAKKYGVTKKVKFKYQDYSHTTFPSRSFDVIWGLESIVHAENKKDFIDEAYRLLKRGGRIIISEYMLRENPPLSDKEVKIISPWLTGWAMPNLLRPKEYKLLLKNAGFQNIKIYNLTDRFRPSLRRLGKLATLAMPIARFLYLLRVFSKEHFGNVEAALSQNKALKLGLWNYTVITAQKDALF